MVTNDWMEKKKKRKHKEEEEEEGVGRCKGTRGRCDRGWGASQALCQLDGTDDAHQLCLHLLAAHLLHQQHNSAGKACVLSCC